MDSLPPRPSPSKTCCSSSSQVLKVGFEWKQVQQISKERLHSIMLSGIFCWNEIFNPCKDICPTPADQVWMQILQKNIMKVAHVRALQGNWMKITKAWWRHTSSQKCTNLNDNQSCRILAKHRLKYLKEYFETCSKLSLTDPVTNSEMLVQCAPKNGKHVNAFECTSPKLSCAMTQSAKLQFSAVLADWLSESILNLTTGINPDTFTKWTKKPWQTVFD